MSDAATSQGQTPVHSPHDPGAFGDLYTEYRYRVFAYFYGRGLQSADAEDLVSVTFEKAWRAIDRFEDRGVPLAHWLFTVARHTLMDYFRRNRMRNTWSLDDPKLEDQLATEDREPTDAEPMLDELTGPQRDVLRLKVYDDRDGEEIAEILGMTYGGVRALQCRGLKKLRELLGDAA